MTTAHSCGVPALGHADHRKVLADVDQRRQPLEARGPGHEVAVGVDEREQMRSAQGPRKRAGVVARPR